MVPSHASALKRGFVVGDFPAQDLLVSGQQPEQEFAPFLAAEQLEIGLADLIEIAAGAAAGLEHRAQLVLVKLLGRHGVEPPCQGVTLIAIAQPDDVTHPVRLRCVADPPRMSSADCTCSWYLGRVADNCVMHD